MPNESFDPTIHAYIDKENKAFVRKSAIEEHERAKEEAALRNQEKGLTVKILKGNTSTVEVLQENAWKERLKDLELQGAGSWEEGNYGQKPIIKGWFDGKFVYVTSYGYGMVGSDSLDKKDAKKLYNYLYPLLIQRDKDAKDNKSRREKRLPTVKIRK